jgi:hypothetical protein
VQTRHSRFKYNDEKYSEQRATHKQTSVNGDGGSTLIHTLDVRELARTARATTMTTAKKDIRLMDKTLSKHVPKKLSPGQACEGETSEGGKRKNGRKSWTRQWLYMIFQAEPENRFRASQT